MAERRRKAAPASGDRGAKLLELSAAVRRWSETEGLTGIGSGYLVLHLVKQARRSQLPAAEVGEAGALLARGAAEGALARIGPRDAAEGLLATQMVATHEAAMECFLRAMIHDQAFEARQANLGQASRLVRSYAVLLEALDRHRGKGQPQVVRVERVTVEAGGQAIVGAVARGGGGSGAGSDERPHAQALAHAPESPLRGANPEGEPVPVAGGGGEGEVPDARRGGG